METRSMMTYSTSTLLPRLIGGRRALILLLLQLVLVFSVVSSSKEGPAIDGIDIEYTGRSPCTVDELLPDYDGEYDLAKSWVQNQLVPPPFDCTCNTLKASYFCPKLGDEGYPKWVPRKVVEGSCRPISRSILKSQPFPPGSKVLFYGNSHLRQVVEGIVCLYSRVVKRRRIRLVDDGAIAQEVIVGPEIHCRSCENHAHSMLDVLVEYGCVDTPESNPCSCDDDNGVFEFENGAIMHYHFAHKEEGKRIEDALRVHDTKFSEYDAIVANPGNDPRLETSELLRTAAKLQDEGVPLLWLSEYEGEGDIRDWTEEERRAFESSGARFVPVHDMVESLSYLTKGAVEGEFNPHFCMPGPPNEIGILLLKIVWALRKSQDQDN